MASSAVLGFKSDPLSLSERAPKIVLLHVGRNNRGGSTAIVPPRRTSHRVTQGRTCRRESFRRNAHQIEDLLALHRDTVSEGSDLESVRPARRLGSRGCL